MAGGRNDNEFYLKQVTADLGIEATMTNFVDEGQEEEEIELNNTCFAKIAKSNRFQTTTLSLIVINALWIGTDVQWNHPIYKEQRGVDYLPLEPWSTIVENIFCGYFSVELIVRFFAYKRKCDCLKDRWFVFDGLLVLFMVIETWILTIVNMIMGGGSDGLLSKFSALRLLRLLRLTRMARLMREVPELLTLVKGMISATKAVSFILMFLIIIMYVFAIVFTAQLGDPQAPENFYAEPYWDTDNDPTGNELFGSLGDSMMTLFTRGMLQDNLAETLQAIKDRGGEIDCGNTTAPDFEYSADNCERTGGSVMLAWVFIAFMIISAFCLLNMLIGVLCEVIQDSAEKEAESSQLNELRNHMAKAFKLIDTSQDGMLSAYEFKQMKLDPAVRSSMANLGVEEEYMDERLDQMQESLFGNLEEEDEDKRPDSPDSALVRSDNSRATRRTTPEGEAEAGLTFDQFIDKVVEIRPDTPACALNIEILRVRVEREEKMFNARLDFIEDALKTGNFAADSPEGVQQASVLRSLGIVPARSGMPMSPPVNSANFLKSVPTEILFSVLNGRSPIVSQAKWPVSSGAAGLGAIR